MQAAGTEQDSFEVFEDKHAAQPVQTDPLAQQVCTVQGCLYFILTLHSALPSCALPERLSNAVRADVLTMRLDSETAVVSDHLHLTLMGDPGTQMAGVDAAMAMLSHLHSAASQSSMLWIPSALPCMMSCSGAFSPP